MAYRNLPAPGDKWQTCIWLAKTWLGEDLADYLEFDDFSDIPYFVSNMQDENLDAFYKRHGMKLKEGETAEAIMRRLARKLYREKNKSQIYAIYYRIIEQPKPDLSDTEPLTEDEEPMQLLLSLE